ncbi:MAG TPA: hypothetical protein VMN57_02595 [Anaerolineales bacterium]|nr:hypothetical protein [Anaerolineales bacterium]
MTARIHSFLYSRRSRRSSLRRTYPAILGRTIARESFARPWASR